MSTSWVIQEFIARGGRGIDLNSTTLKKKTFHKLMVMYLEIDFKSIEQEMYTLIKIMDAEGNVKNG